MALRLSNYKQNNTFKTDEHKKERLAAKVSQREVSTLTVLEMLSLCSLPSIIVVIIKS